MELVDIQGRNLGRKEEDVTEVRGGPQGSVHRWSQGERVVLRQLHNSL